GTSRQRLCARCGGRRSRDCRYGREADAADVASYLDDRLRRRQRRERARSVGRVMLGLTMATLLGVPLATSFGQTFGWRTTFAGVGAIGALTVLLIWRFVPTDSPDANASPLR